MLIMKIQNENSFLQALQAGISLFTGSGFSLLAKDKNNNNLPTGAQLCKELQERFNKPQINNLSYISTILEKSQKDEYYNYLSDRFKVEHIDSLYYHINKLNIKNIYTTNIDNLIPKIFSQHPSKFLNDQLTNGLLPDKDAVNYLPLHGSVDQPIPKFVFDVASINNIYNDAPRIWNYLSHGIETYPTLFLGYSFNDAAVIQAVTSKSTFQNAQKDKWILLLETEESMSEFFEALGFNIIYGDIKQFLNYIGTHYNQDNLSDSLIWDESIELLGSSNKVPNSIFELSFQRPINDFFRGLPPEWSDVLSNQLYKTHYVNEIKNSIYDAEKNTIIIGAPVTGKTTVLMQLASMIDDWRYKLIYDNITISRAEYIVKLIGKNKAIIFVDNLYDSIDVLPVLDKPNIKIVAAERTHNWSIVSHLVDPSRYNVINITSLTNQDIQGIYDALPLSLRKQRLQKATSKDNKQDSIFEFVIRNITHQNIKERYRKFMSELEQDDPDLVEFLVLCGFIHSCRIPLSFEMAYSYFDDLNANAIMEMQKDVSDMITEFRPDNFIYNPDIDYYYPRSLYLAETIRDQCPIKILQKVLRRIIEQIPTVVICNYPTFRKHAFDKSIVDRAFPSWKDGQEFYEQVFLYDRKNPFVLQQGALYLAQKKQFPEAFIWIDKALNMTDNKYFSIRNSHAIILFDANINKSDRDGGVRNLLDESMMILKKCMKADARKRFHAIRFGVQSLRYYEKYGDDQAQAYIVEAKRWLDEQIKTDTWDYEANNIRTKLLEVMSIFQ